jgi:hypothetical protein
MWKKAAVAYFNVLSHRALGGKKKHTKFESGLLRPVRNSNPLPLEYEAVLITDLLRSVSVYKILYLTNFIQLTLFSQPVFLILYRKTEIWQRFSMFLSWRHTNLWLRTLQHTQSGIILKMCLYVCMYVCMNKLHCLYYSSYFLVICVPVGLILCNIHDNS